LIQTSSNLVDWLPISTNVSKATPANPDRFSEVLSTGTARFYRAGLVPNQ
jgi:hypothetical protein